MYERTVSKRTVFRGKVFGVQRHQVVLPGGRRAVRDLISHPGAVAVVPVLDDGRIVLIRQFRKAIEQVLCEIPAGTREKGERLAVCVRRELAEETGYRARKIKRLVTIYPVPGYSSEMIDIYVATGLTASAANPEADEQIEVVPMKPERIVKMIRSGTIKDGKTIAGILCYLGKHHE